MKPKPGTTEFKTLSYAEKAEIRAKQSRRVREAAPDLLAALKALVREVETARGAAIFEPEPSEAMDAAYEAISKASD
jgi:hypothetical protein